MDIIPLFAFESAPPRRDHRFLVRRRNVLRKVSELVPIDYATLADRIQVVSAADLMSMAAGRTPVPMDVVDEVLGVFDKEGLDTLRRFMMERGDGTIASYCLRRRRS